MCPPGMYPCILLIPCRDRNVMAGSESSCAGVDRVAPLETVRGCLSVADVFHRSPPSLAGERRTRV
jgi:hypothetical protein